MPVTSLDLAAMDIGTSLLPNGEARSFPDVDFGLR